MLNAALCERSSEQKVVIFACNKPYSKLSQSRSDILIKNSLAEFEKDLFKDQDRPCAAKDGERLSSKKREGHARERRSKQRFDGTLSSEQGEGDRKEGREGAGKEKGRNGEVEQM